MKLKCDECKGVGNYDCDSEPGPYGTRINVECPDCDGAGWIDLEDDYDEEPITLFVDELCDKISDKFIQDAEAVFMTFTGDSSRNYHVTYFINRGDVTAEETPLLGGLTLSADSITHAVTIFINSTGVSEREIKYIVEL
jgi:hypothetical protein